MVVDDNDVVLSLWSSGASPSGLSNNAARVCFAQARCTRKGRQVEWWRWSVAAAVVRVDVLSANAQALLEHNSEVNSVAHRAAP